MSAPSCRRRFEVDAARDGRLTGSAQSSIEQHTVTCEVCAAYARALGDVSDALRALPVAEPDALSVRRQRQRILALFDEAQIAPETRAKRVGRVRAALVAGTVATLAGVVAIRSHGMAPSAASVKPVARIDDVVVVAPEAARWSRAEQGQNTRLTLDDGELDVQVKHHGDAHRLVVKLPDGELEDIGTTFRVRVQNGRTVSVVVREGAVVLRRGGSGAVLVGAGESWTVDEPRVPASAPAGASAEPLPVPKVPAPPPRTITPARGDSDRQFREGVDLLNEGNAAQAAAAFRAYLGHDPSAGRAEDASYLLVLALHRAADDAAARAAARDYLLRYPSGLRRQEVERLFPEETDR